MTGDIVLDRSSKDNSLHNNQSSAHSENDTFRPSFDQGYPHASVVCRGQPFPPRIGGNGRHHKTLDVPRAVLSLWKASFHILRKPRQWEASLSLTELSEVALSKNIPVTNKFASSFNRWVPVFGHLRRQAFSKALEIIDTVLYQLDHNFADFFFFSHNSLSTPDNATVRQIVSRLLGDVNAWLLRAAANFASLAVGRGQA